MAPTAIRSDTMTNVRTELRQPRCDHSSQESTVFNVCTRGIRPSKLLSPILTLVLCFSEGAPAKMQVRSRSRYCARVHRATERATLLPGPLVDMIMLYAGVLRVWRDESPRLLDLPRPAYGQLLCLTSGHIVLDGVVVHVTDPVASATARLLGKAVKVEFASVTTGWWQAKSGGLSYMLADKEVRHLPGVDVLDLWRSGTVRTNGCLWFVDSRELRASTQLESRSWPLKDNYGRIFCAEGDHDRLLYAECTRDLIEVLMFDIRMQQAVLLWSCAAGDILRGIGFSQGAAAFVMHETRPKRDLVYFTPECGAVDFVAVADITQDKYEVAAMPQVCLMNGLVIVLTVDSVQFVCPVQRKVMRRYAPAENAKFYTVFQLRGTNQVVVIEIAANHAVRALIFHVENFN